MVNIDVQQDLNTEITISVKALKLVALIVCILSGMAISAEESVAALSQNTPVMDAEDSKRLGLTFENITLEVEGLKRDYVFLWIVRLGLPTNGFT